MIVAVHMITMNLNMISFSMVDYSEGWNDGSSIYIDGYGEYNLEEGFLIQFRMVQQ